MKKRKIFKSLENWLDSDEILFLVGARQVGKTTLMKQLESKLKESKEKTFFIR